MDAEVDKVLTICPDVDVDDVIRDLNSTGSAETTINRIFEGTFLSGLDEDLSPASSPHDHHRSSQLENHLPSDDEDDDDLPDICINRLRNERLRDTYNAPIRRTEKYSDVHQDIIAIPDDVYDPDVSKTSLDPTSDDNEGMGRVDRWLQQSLSSSKKNKQKHLNDDDVCIDLDRENQDFNRKSPSASRHSTSTNYHKEMNGNGRRRKISVSSSEEEEPVSKKIHNSFLPSSYSKPVAGTSMKRSCSPISLSDSDDDEELLTVTLKQRLPGHLLPRTDSPLSAMSTASTMDSQQTDETASTMGTGSVCSMTQDSQDPMGKKKRRRTPEEIEAAKRQALERKHAREMEREAKKLEKQKERDQKKVLQAAKKADRPEECMKFIRVVLDPLLLEEVGGAAILAKLESLDSKYTIESQRVPSVVMWRRLGACSNLGEDIALHSISTEKDEIEVLVLIPTAVFIDLVYIFKQEQQGVLTGEESLRTHVINIKRAMPGKKVTLMVMNIEAYFRKEKNCKNRNFRSAVLGTQLEEGKKKKRKKGVEEITTSISRVDMEEALVDLQLHTDCNVKLVEKAEQVAEMIAMFTKSVAETPFKRERDKASFSFHVDNEWAGGVKVNKEGVGLLKLWRQQLQQFRNVSPDMASAVVAVYPSPGLLLKAYDRCSSPRDAQMLLANINVRRGEGILATSKRIGPALSKRLYALLTSKNGELVL